MTIYENFKLVAPDKNTEDYIRYASIVNIDKEISEMPEGLHTPINSNTISTGQRQRIALCMTFITRYTTYHIG